MNETSKEWTTKKLEKLRVISDNYSTQEKDKINLDYINNLLLRLPELKIEKNDILIKELEDVIDYLPLKFDDLNYRSYLSKFNDVVYLVVKRFKLSPKKYYRKNTDMSSLASISGYLFIGLFVFLSFVIFKNPILIGIGVLLSLVFIKLGGIYQDKRAEKENRVI